MLSMGPEYLPTEYSVVLQGYIPLSQYYIIIGG